MHRSRRSNLAVDMTWMTNCHRSGVSPGQWIHHHFWSIKFASIEIHIIRFWTPLGRPKAGASHLRPWLATGWVKNRTTENWYQRSPASKVTLPHPVIPTAKSKHAVTTSTWSPSKSSAKMETMARSYRIHRSWARFTLPKLKRPVHSANHKGFSIKYPNQTLSPRCPSPL